MENEDLKNRATLADISLLIEQVRVLGHKVDQLLQVLEINHQHEQLFGDWISEHDLIIQANLSRGTLLNLKKRGLLTTSSIAGKANYYKMSQIRELLNENEKNR
ncbi:MAG: hypothetical protein HYU68_00400 [Bacteroidetes bacterium]|nr:hypothetical protein [Bacteroidota bacterium]